jgi:S1-C subfamily serine protease
MFLLPASDSKRPFQKDVLGMLVMASPRGFSVFNVAPSGPAATAGLKAGDRIRLMNDAPVDRSKIEALNVASAGEEVRFELEDGSVKTVTLAAYY